MHDIKLNKGLLLLALILVLASLLLGVTLSWIKDNTFFKIEHYVSYKWMLLLLLIIILVLLYLLVYIKLFSKFDSKSENFESTPSNQIREQLKNLTQKEKEYLKKYLDTDERTLKFLRTDDVANGLCSIGILENVSLKESILPTYSYKIVEIYWNHLKKNPKILKL